MSLPFCTSVLLVEDNDEHALLFSRAFKAHPAVRLHRLGDALQAQAYLRGEGRYADRSRYPRPSAVITDLKMPLCSGLEFIRWFRSHPEWVTIPVVVVSSSLYQSDMDRCYAEGAQAFLLKPCTDDGFRHLFSCLMKLWRRYGVIETGAEGFPSGDSGSPWSFDHTKSMDARLLQSIGREREES